MLDFLKKVRRCLIKFAGIQKIHIHESEYVFKYGGGGIVADALLLCHSLEKGMGISNVKKGYGLENAVKLLRLMPRLKSSRADLYVYAESYAVIEAYIKYQCEDETDVTGIEKRFKELEPPNLICDGGMFVISKSDLLKGCDYNFKAFVTTKHSMRESSNEEVTEEEIRNAIHMALSAPSACNRQPCKVYYSLDESSNYKLSRLVPGNKSFSNDIKYYSVITADKSLFGGTESYQWYLNSGIFVSYFTLSLHSIGLGSCIFQWPDFYESDTEVRKLISKIDKKETIVAIVGYGKYPDELKCIYAQRRPIVEVAVKF